MAKLILENRRNRVRRLIDIAIEDGNVVSQFKGYYLLNLINKRLAQVYSFENLYSNLY